MAAKKLREIAGFLGKYPNCVLYAGYDKKGVPCLYIKTWNKRKNRTDFRDVPRSWEYICDYGLSEAWEAIKTHFSGQNSLAYDVKTDQLIANGLEL